MVRICEWKKNDNEDKMMKQQRVLQPEGRCLMELNMQAEFCYSCPAQGLILAPTPLGGYFLHHQEGSMTDNVRGTTTLAHRRSERNAIPGTWD